MNPESVCHNCATEFLGPTGTHNNSRSHRWRLLIEDDDDPLSNLAREEAIGRTPAPRPTVRIWRNRACVVVGRFQVSEAEVDHLACQRLHIPVYRRFTGGGAVYHDLGNINVSLVMPRDHHLLRSQLAPSGVPSLYTLILQPMADAVASMGLLATRTSRELLIRNLKVSGVAAWLGNNTVLLHATLLVDADLDKLRQVLNGPGAPQDHRWQRTRSRRVQVTSLVKEGLLFSGAHFVQLAVVVALARKFDVVLETAALTPSEQMLANELLIAKYSQPLWHANG